MGSRAGSKRTNPHYQKMRNETVEKVRQTLRKLEGSKRTYETLSQVLRDVSVFSGVARSTLKPYRNAEAYRLVAGFFGTQAVDPNNVPDEIPDEHVLRMKLALLRAEYAHLKREIRRQRALVVGADSASTANEGASVQMLYQTLAQLLDRARGSIFVDINTGQLIDKFPERGFDRVIASGKAVKQFGQWLKTHPGFQAKGDLFSDG